LAAGRATVAEVVSLDVGDDESVAMICYSGGSLSFRRIPRGGSC
jgi:hypothetical protein